jgi:polyhydroxyalkanoate synthesis repressor PhaR
MTDMIVLKKYANRRLYDTQRSSYVTLSEVADDIRKGKTVSAFDAKTKEDVTAFVLTQIILEETKNHNALLPVPLLHMIIRYGENVLREFFENYLEQTVNAYLAHKSKVDEQFKKWLEFGMDYSAFAQKSLTRLNPFQSFFDQFSESKTPPDEKDEPDRS